MSKPETTTLVYNGHELEVDPNPVVMVDPVFVDAELIYHHWRVGTWEIISGGDE